MSADDTEQMREALVEKTNFATEKGDEETKKEVKRRVKRIKKLKKAGQHEAAKREAIELFEYLGWYNQFL